MGVFLVSKYHGVSMRKKRGICFIYVLVLSFLCYFLGYSGDDQNKRDFQLEFPFMASVVKDGAKLRADSRISSPVIVELERGEVIKVVGSAYGWYKVLIPSGVRVCLYGKYVKLNGDCAQVIADRVNVRMRCGLQYPVLGQVNSGQRLKICPTGEKVSEGWVCVLSDGLELYGWMHSSLLKPLRKLNKEVVSESKSKTVNRINFSKRGSSSVQVGRQIELDLRIRRFPGNLEKKEGKEGVAENKENNKIGQLPKNEEVKISSNSNVEVNGDKTSEKSLPIARGRVEDVGRILGVKFSYKIVNEKGKVEYYLKSQEDIGRFSGDWVEVYGDVCGVSGKDIPVLCVKKIERIKRR